MSSPLTLIIEAYDSEDLSGSAVASYAAQLNPATHSMGHTLATNASVAPEHGGPHSRTINFNLLFGSTGGIDGAAASPLIVSAELKKFEATAYAFDGKIHHPRYLKIAWGERDTFQCMLTSLSITYQLFDAQGIPIRAVAQVTFTSPTPTATRAQS